MAQPPAIATLALVKDFIGSTLYRVIWPSNALQARGYPAYTIPAGHEMLGKVVAGWNPAHRPVDAVILPRMYWSPADQAQGDAEIAARQASGQMVIAEWDDEVFTPACYDQFALLEPGVARAEHVADREARLHCLAQVDGVTVSTPYLAAVVRQYTPRPVMVAPNGLDWGAFHNVFPHTPRTVAGLTIGWVGGTRLEHDVAALAVAWRRIAERFPAVQFVLGGYHSPLLVEAVPPERLHREPWRHMGQFPAAYRNVDIGCCPLANVPFNRAKSIVKSLEYGAAGAAVVYSPTVYGAEMRHGKDGLEANTADDWEKALSYLIEHPAERHRMARRWAQRVQARYTTAQTCWSWVKAWQVIHADYLARRPKLVAV